MADQQMNETLDTKVAAQGKHENCEPSQQVRFAFGPGGQCYIHTRSGPVSRSFWALRFDSSNELQIGPQTCFVAITADGGIFQAKSNCTLSSDSTGPTFEYSGPTGPASAFELAYWQLNQKFGSKQLFALDDQTHANLTLGPRGSYFVVTKDGPRWHNLPEDLAAEIQAAKSKPFHIALGVDQTWVCIWPDHSFSWNLQDKYQGLATKLQAYAKVKDTIALVALAPYDDSGSWFVVDCDGVISHRINNTNNQVLHGVQSLALHYMQQQARRTGLTITNKHTWKSMWGRDKSAEYKITPSTKFDEFEAPLLLMRTLPFSQQVQEFKRYMPYRLGQRDVLVSAAVGCSVAWSCNMFGLKARPALVAGALAGLMMFNNIPRNEPK